MSAPQLPGPGAFPTLIDALRWRATQQPDRRAFLFLPDGETAGDAIDYEALDRRARALAARLQAGDASGERVLILHPPGLDYLVAFLACLYAGAVAVPAYPPRPGRPLPRLQAIRADAAPALAIAAAPIRDRLAATPDFVALRWLTPADAAPAEADRWRSPDPAPDALCYLQYTSGSTAAPKGVMVSHRNLMVTLADMDRGWDHSPDSVIVSWLPPFHDLGLIYGLLQPLYLGCLGVSLPPEAFVRRPARWLEALSRFGGTHSAGPNFAYDLCARKTTPAERAGLDLSRWRVALNAAEPVRLATIERFAAAFAPHGFRRRAFAAGYGLAEATLKVSTVPVDAETAFLHLDAAALERHRVVPQLPGAPGVRAVAGCGWPGAVADVRIVDPETRAPCPPDGVGEIWIAGPNVPAGYWRRPEATRETFGARLAGDEGPFLRTGDLGFLRDGQIFVTGRLKDLIIIRGRNHYPQDLELTAEQSHPALRPGNGAAFSLDAAGEERLALVYEVRPGNPDAPGAVMAAVRAAILAEHEVAVWAIALLRPDEVPKTSSGKVQRRETRARYLAGTLAVVDAWQAPPEVEAASEAPDDLEQWLVATLAARLDLAPGRLPLTEPLDRFGLDSVGVAELTAALSARLGRDLPPTLLYELPTVAALVAHLRGAPATPPATPPRLGFVFPGWRPGAGPALAAAVRRLRANEPTFTAALAQAMDALDLSPEAALEASDDEAAERGAYLAFQVSLAATWRTRGLRPAFVVGHGAGEVAAAWAAGALSPADAALVARRQAVALAGLPGRGEAAWVALSLAAAEEALAPSAGRLAVAAHDAPEVTVIAGEAAALADLLARLRAAGVVCRHLGPAPGAQSPTAAFPSAALEAALAGLRPRPGDLPVTSTVTGDQLAGEALDAAYWARQPARPVVFAAAMRRLLRREPLVCLEIGPAAALLPAIAASAAHWGRRGEGIASLTGAAAADDPLAPTWGRLVALGVAPEAAP